MMKDFVRRGRSNSSAAALASSASSVSSSPRMSILPSVRLPSLRRQESQAPPTHDKTPLLTLTLSSQTFLDSSVKDIYSAEPLYQIKTIGTSTTVSRKDPIEPSVIAASIKWPRQIPLRTKGKEYSDGVLVQMKGARWSGGESVLRPAASENASRKFNIPNFSQSMKWKQYGSTYWCSTSSVKGPIATLKLAKGQIPTILTVYETLHDKYDPRALSAFKGVSILLLDHLLVTALLLVTDLQDWMLVRKFEGKEPSIHQRTESNGQGRTSGSSVIEPELPPTSDPQWRKIMFGEPIYPKREAQSRKSDASMSPTTPAFPRTPTSPAPAGLAPHAYIDSEEGSSSRQSGSSGSRKIDSRISSSVLDEDFTSEPEDVYEVASTRPPSPSAESIHFTSGAPSHTYLDPSFYGSQSQESLPPVPPLPSQYAKSLNGRNFSSQPSTPVSATFRQLPPPPALPSHLQQYNTISARQRRRRSSPPSTPSSAQLEFANPDADGGSDTDSLLPVDAFPPHLGPQYHLPQEVVFRSYASSTRSDSIRSSNSFASGSSRPRSQQQRRPLPRPPPVPPVDNAPPVVHSPAPGAPGIGAGIALFPVRRAQSANQLLSITSSPLRDTPPRPQRSLPPTPQESRMVVPTSSLAEELEFVLEPEDEALLGAAEARSRSRSRERNLYAEQDSTPTLAPTPRYATPSTSSSPSPPPILPPLSHSPGLGLLHPSSHLHPDRTPPITKASQEDLTEWVHKLTSPQRDLPAAPLPSTSIFDVPPPAYSSINFSTRPEGVERPPVPVVSVPFGVPTESSGVGPSR